MIRFFLCRNFIVCTTILFLSMAASVSAQDEIRLIIRGDDLGMTQGSLAAFEDAFNNGMLSSAGILVIAPWFEAAAELCKNNPGWCTGVHLALVGEWRGYRWRPVLPWSEVPSLVDEDGFLYGSPEELLANNPDPDEVEAELRAQVELALNKGINVQYIDSHYTGIDLKLVEKIAQDYNLPKSGSVGEKWVKHVYLVPVEQKIDQALENLDNLDPGLWVWVTHPGIDSPEHNALIHTNPDHIFPGGGVGKHRASETDVLTSIELKSMILRKGIRVVSYREVWEEKAKEE